MQLQAVIKQISKKAVNSLAPFKLTKATIPRTDSIITNEVERAKSDADSEAPMVPKVGAPTLAPIFNANKCKVGKKKTVEKFYQKRTQLEYILLRPDIYIGSTKVNSQWQLIYDDTTDSLIEKDIRFVPSFLKVFDESLFVKGLKVVYHGKFKYLGPPMSKIKVTIDPEQNLILVYNNGSRILVEIHKEEKGYIPKLIFGHLLTSSNYDDSEKKVVGEYNGYGAKLCNIFSTEFIVETASKESGKKYYQKFTNNMSVIGTPKITKLGKGEEFTRITF
ncbi:DNA topoisomerase 2 [Massospora cicadina]|nr:DNA topoisomerase 2 [Massospora cicadina]